MSDSLSMSELRRLITDQQQKIDQLEKKVTVAERQAEAAEQYSRQDCLILRGKLNIRPNHSFREEVMRLIDFHTGVRFPGWCVNTTHWLGGGNSIIIRFNNKAVRDEVYRNRVPKEVGRRGLFIHESLTASKTALVSRCAALRNKQQITTYYTQGGHVLVKKSKQSPSILVTPDMTEDNIIEKLNRQPDSYREAVVQQGDGQNLRRETRDAGTASATGHTRNEQNMDKDTEKNTETSQDTRKGKSKHEEIRKNQASQGQPRQPSHKGKGRGIKSSTKTTHHLKASMTKMMKVSWDLTALIQVMIRKQMMGWLPQNKQTARTHTRLSQKKKTRNSRKRSKQKQHKNLVCMSPNLQTRTLTQKAKTLLMGKGLHHWPLQKRKRRTTNGENKLDRIKPSLPIGTERDFLPEHRFIHVRAVCHGRVDWKSSENHNLP